MTPLARDLAEDNARPLFKKTWQTDMADIGDITQFHCFDVTGVWKQILDIGKELRAAHMVPKQLMFLPSEKTWVEYRDAVIPLAFAFIKVQDGIALFQAACKTLEFVGTVNFDEGTMTFNDLGPRLFGKEADDNARTIVTLTAAILTIINSPRGVSIKTHQPHSGFQKILARARGQAGKYPLPDWHEVTLSVGQMVDRSSTNSNIGIGHKKAWHFVRTHLRKMSNGNLIPVIEHYRGDPMIGIRKKRYKVVYR